MVVQSRKKSCIYINVNGNNAKKHRDGKMSEKEKVEKLLAKALVSLKNHKTAFNLELDGQRYFGRYMSHVKLEDGVVSFKYDNEDIEVKASEMVAVKRLRTRKFLFFVKKTEKVVEKAAKVKKTVNNKKKANKDEV